MKRIWLIKQRRFLVSELVKLEKEELELIDSVCEQVKSIIVEGEFNARWTLLHAYHQVGKLIVENFRNPTEIVATVAVKINRSERTLWYAVAFAKKYPDINKLPEGKNISWRKLINNYLTDGKKEDKKMIKCPNCGFEF